MVMLSAPELNALYKSSLKARSPIFWPLYCFITASRPIRKPCPSCHMRPVAAGTSSTYIDKVKRLFVEFVKIYFLRTALFFNKNRPPDVKWLA